MTQNSVAPDSEQLTSQAPQSDGQEPTTASEKYLASLLSEIIGMSRINLPDKFLDIGGNSLTLNIILNRIETEKGASLPPELFFDDERSSLFELAKELDALLENQPDQSQETTPALDRA